MSNVTATYEDKDQNWMDETTIYWFRLNGADYGTKLEFDNDQYGIADCNGDETVVDCDGYPVDYNEHVARVVARECVITEQMRAE